MTQQFETSDDLENLVLDAQARFTREEFIARRDAFNATVSVDEL